MLAVFPLNIVVFPGECVALHLFEERYKQLFQDHKNGKEFVIVFKDEAYMSKSASTVFIDKIVNEFPDGTVDVIVKGKSVVKINEFIQHLPNKLYSAVEVNKINLSSVASEKLQDYFETYMASLKKEVKEQPPYSNFYIANRLELNAKTKDELLKLNSPQELDLFLINEIKFIQKIKEQEIQLDQKFYLN